MCQLSKNELIILGGFSGAFMHDYNIIKVDEASGNLIDF